VKKYQQIAVDTPGGLKVSMPERVGVAMAEIARGNM